jgi:hypothetical protein
MMMYTSKYIIYDGSAIVFSPALSHSEIVPKKEKITSAGFVSFKIKIDSFGQAIVVAEAYGRSDSLDIDSKKGDSDLITRQITNPNI